MYTVFNRYSKVLLIAALLSLSMAQLSSEQPTEDDFVVFDNSNIDGLGNKPIKGNDTVPVVESVAKAVAAPATKLDAKAVSKVEEVSVDEEPNGDELCFSDPSCIRSFTYCYDGGCCYKKACGIDGKCEYAVLC